MDPLDIARWQFGITTVYHFLHGPAHDRPRHDGRRPADDVGAHRADERVPAHHEVLGKALPDQLHRGRRDRARPGVPVRHGLERVLPLRRRRVRRSARDGGPARLLRRVDLPRRLDLRLGSHGPQGPAPRAALWCAVIGSWLSALLHHRRQLVDAAPRRRRDERRRPPRHDRCLGSAHEQHRPARPTRHTIFGALVVAGMFTLGISWYHLWRRRHDSIDTVDDTGHVIVGSGTDIPAATRPTTASGSGRCAFGAVVAILGFAGTRHHRRRAGQAHVRAAAHEDGLCRSRLPHGRVLLSALASATPADRATTSSPSSRCPACSDSSARASGAPRCPASTTSSPNTSRATARTMPDEPDLRRARRKRDRLRAHRCG